MFSKCKTCVIFFKNYVVHWDKFCDLLIYILAASSFSYLKKLKF